jgi:nucleotide-binding universal stress UspA family protein
VKRVLVPLDGTRNAEQAVAGLADICGPEYEVVLLQVEKPHPPQRTGYRPSEAVTAVILGPAGGIAQAAAPDVPVYAETSDQALQRQVSEAKDYLEKLAAGLRQRGHRVETEVLIGDEPDEAIIDYARRTRPTFIAMLRRTHSRLPEFIFGSVASSIVRSDVAPVLLVPAVGAAHAPRH